MITSLLIAYALISQVSAEQTFERPQGAAQDVVAIIDNLSPDATSEKLRSTAAQCASLLVSQSPTAKGLREIAGSDLALDDIRRRFNEVRDNLVFELLREADLPADFPTYTPPGVIELKLYPASRRVVGKEFFPLFAHITRNKIAMTAPVRMEFSHAEDGELQQESMAFFYGDVGTGSLGPDEQDEDVSTIAGERETVIALGQRGRWNRKVIAQGEELLREWTKANPDHEVTGGVIVMGYNSPMTPTACQFFEIQLPVKRVRAE